MALLFLVLLAGALALCLASDFHRMETHIARETFMKHSRSDRSAVHEVIVAVRKNHMDELMSIAIERATPGHALYQHWLSGEEVDEMVVNLPGYAAATDWLASDPKINITWVSRRFDYIKAQAPIHVWETMLNTQFHEFVDTSYAKHKTFHRAHEYSIPNGLLEHITAIFNTVQTPPQYHARFSSKDGAFTSHLRLRSAGASTAADANAVTIAFLNSYYNITSNNGSAMQNQSVFSSYDSQYFSPSDLTVFQQTYGTKVQSAISIGGHSTTESCTTECEEGNLDIQYIMGVAQITSSIFWWVANSNDDPFVE